MRKIISENQGAICGLFLGTGLLLIGGYFQKDALELKLGQEIINYEYTPDRLLWILGVVTLFIGAITGSMFDFHKRFKTQHDNSAKEKTLDENTEKLFMAMINASNAAAESVKLALHLPSQHINTQNVVRITESIANNIIGKIRDRFFEKSPHLLNSDIAIDALLNMMEGIGNEIELSDTIRGLPVERKLMVTESVAKKFTGKDYPNFVINSLEYAIEFYGVSLMPPTMWLDDEFGLDTLLKSQAFRLNVLKENSYDPVFQRILLCPSTLIDNDHLKKLKDIHETSGIKLFTVGDSTGDDFTYEDYSSHEYNDFVLVKCHEGQWFCLTSYGFNELTRQNDLQIRCEIENENITKSGGTNIITPAQMLTKLFKEKYGGFVEGRLIYNSDAVIEYMREWNKIISKFGKDKEHDMTEIPDPSFKRLENVHKIQTS